MIRLKLLWNVPRILVVKSFFVIASSLANKNRPAGNDELSRLIALQKDSNIIRNISIVTSAYYVLSIQIDCATTLNSFAVERMILIQRLTCVSRGWQTYHTWYVCHTSCDRHVKSEQQIAKWINWNIACVFTTLHVLFCKRWKII